MAHYFVFQNRLASPFHTIRDLKMVLPSGRERRQRSTHPKVMFMLGGGDCLVRMLDGFRARLSPGGVLVVPKPCHHFYSIAGSEDLEVDVFGLFLKAPTRKNPRQSEVESEIQALLGELLSETIYIPDGVTPAISSLIHQFREEFSAGLPGGLVRQQLLATELLVTLARQQRRTISPEKASLRVRSQAFIANEVREYLGKTIHRPHTLTQIAAHFNLSEEHLARLFRKETGMSVMHFLRSLRVDTGRKMLLRTHHPISVMAGMLGFNSSNHFCRAFHRETGQTPSDYRRKHYSSEIAPQ